MSRLTEKNGDRYVIRENKDSNDYLLAERTSLFDCVQKLGQREDVEEKAGVGFIVFYRAFTEGIWVKADEFACGLDNEPTFIPPEHLEIGRDDYYEYGVGDKKNIPIRKEKNALCFYTHHYEETEYMVRVKDFGKTWALTKEELE